MCNLNEILVLNQQLTETLDSSESRNADGTTATNCSPDLHSPPAQCTLLKPLIPLVPDELKELHRWVLWKDGKVPFDPRFPNRCAASNNPDTWGSYQEASNAFEEGGYAGIGFVLNGDGIACIDLDDCVIDGTPAPEALELLRATGCQYIEYSPSGTGLHGWGRIEPGGRKGRKGNIGSLKVEAYTDRMYITVTGRHVLNGPLVLLHGFDELYARIRGSASKVDTEEPEDTDETDFSSSVSSVASVTSVSSVGVSRYPKDCCPSGKGQRNRCIFNLARHLKATCPNSDLQELRPRFELWHEEFVSVFGTKDLQASWIDFCNAFRAVKVLKGDEVFTACAARATASTEKTPADKYGERANRLYLLLQELQKHYGAEPLFLSVRKAGEFLGCDYTDAASLLRWFVSEGMLHLVSKGSGARASRYRLIGATPSR